MRRTHFFDKWLEIHLWYFVLERFISIMRRDHYFRVELPNCCYCLVRIQRVSAPTDRHDSDINNAECLELFFAQWHRHMTQYNSVLRRLQTVIVVYHSSRRHTDDRDVFDLILSWTIDNHAVMLR